MTATSLREAVNELRRYGPWAFPMKILGGLGIYRRAVLYQISLLDPVATVEPPAGTQTVRLDESNLPEMAQLREAPALESMRSRLRRGDACFGARLDGRLVCIYWGATIATEMPYLHCTLTPRDREVYIYDSFTLPDCRGRGIAPAVRNALRRHYRTAGYTSAVCAVLPENRSARRGVEKAGYVACGTVGRVAMGAFQRTLGTDVRIRRSKDQRGRTHRATPRS